MPLSVGDKERAERALKRSIYKRDMTIEQINILAGMVSTVEKEADTLPLLLARRKDIDMLMTDFRLDQEEILTQLITLDRDEEFTTSHASLNAQVLEKYYLITATCSELGIGKTSPSVQPSLQNVQLPKIQIPTFDGDLLQWRSFRDTFCSLIHDNTQLSPIQKFHYLISATSGHAASVVRSLPLSDENYTIAWNTLHERFDDKRSMLNAHMDTIFRFTPLTNESLSGLKRFLNTFQENVASINALGVENLSGYILFYIASRVLDSNTKKLFEFEYHDTDIPTLDMLLDFIKIRCQVLQNSISSLNVVISKPNDVNRKSFKPKSSFLATSSSYSLSSSTSSSTTCVLCKDNHILSQCNNFIKKPVKQRFRFAQTKKLCMNCLSTLHKTNACISTHTCRHCSLKHHTLLHLNTQQPKSPTLNTDVNTPSSVNSSSSSDSSATKTFVGTSCGDSSVVIGTAIIQVQDFCGEWTNIRALIDPGSQISVISRACVSRLRLRLQPYKIDVTGLENKHVSTTKGSVQCIIRPRHNTTPEIHCGAFVLPQITGLMPQSRLPTKIRSTYNNINFADSRFDIPGSIDFLLGADIYPKLLGNSSKVLHSTGLPSAYETLFGWIVVGLSSTTTFNSPMTLSLTSTLSVEHLLKRFWEIEEVIPNNILFTADQKCEDHFQRTVSRDSTGRFSLALPFKNDPSLLGSSLDMAISRFYNLERKLIKDPVLYDHYRAFMREYEDLGHMQVATRPGKYIIPHHAIVKKDNGKFKIRVVFDASATSSSGKSLNDILYVGPKLQIDISQLLHRCRFYKYMFTTDICKMYRQINIHSDDRIYQHILWRNHVSEPLREYELNTVTYGVTSAPYQAIRVLHKLEQEDGHLFPFASNILSSQTYVDDILSGHNTITELFQQQDHVTKLLLRAGFQLKKWASNCPDLLRQIPEEDRSMEISFEPKDETSIKILGLHWDPVSDIFTYHSDVTKLPVIYTKRSILSTIAKLFDPLGALGPIIFWAKCFLQLLWQAKLGWDDPLPQSLSDSWKKYSSEIPLVNNIKINRYIFTSDSNNIQLIGFSDASEKGYAAVVYVRILHIDGNSSVHFVTSKSKVAPVKFNSLDKSLTIPRMELCGALLLAQTMNRLITTFQKIKCITSVHAWTDSQVVLSWLTSSPLHFKIFVTNRLAKISELLPTCSWHYISSELNPADCVSRGLLPSQLLAFELYWKGPSFLSSQNNVWESNNNFQPLEPKQLPDYKETSKTCLILSDENKCEWFARFSSLSRLQRVTVRILRLFKFARRKTIPFSTSLNSPITNVEIEDAMLIIVRQTQHLHFKNILKAMQSSTKVISPRSVAQLAPFVDKDNIMRVGGRLRNANIPYNVQHPILLPKSSWLSTLIIRHFHITNMHAGPQLTSSLILGRYWILSSRSVVRYVIFKCLICAKYRAVTPQPFMADLPISRVTQSRLFLHVGVDFAGPLLIKEGRRKNARSVKCYLCIFVCMSVKAVHIEVVSELTTNAFVAALHRFVARRGIPSDIYSDCGTNFKGANQYLQQMFDEPHNQTIFLNSLRCKWHFNPPAAPHFGGLWESVVKSTKYHLRRVVGNQTLTFEELSTFSCRIEALLNSRPLIPQSSDPNDLRSLTPGDFLIGNPLVDLPERDVTLVQKNRLNRWELLRQLYQSFWRRWSEEYLKSLQRRSKWYKSLPNVKIGDLVLISAPNQPPMHWKLGRVELVHAGSDGIVRVATVRTVDSTFIRPVIKLAVLPLDPPNK